MIYKHEYFQLDTESKKVFDENGKELLLTGNAYRMLVFLCEKKHANLTEIGDYLDHAKEYTENHLRQYRYKIETIIGRDVIEYQNGMYSIIGNVQESLEMAKVDRNTDLLQQGHVQFQAGNMQQHQELKFWKFPAVIAVAMLLFSYLKWPYGYYTLLRIVVAGAGIYYAYYLHAKKESQNFWFGTMVAIAILFNPVFIIGFQKSVWGVIDFVVACIIFTFTFFNERHEKRQF